MNGVLSYIIKSLVGNVSGCRALFTESDNELRFFIKIPRSMRHMIIGKDGKIINAVRDYLKVVSKKFGNKKVFVKVDEI